MHAAGQQAARTSRSVANKIVMYILSRRAPFCRFFFAPIAPPVRAGTHAWTHAQGVRGHDYTRPERPGTPSHSRHRIRAIASRSVHRRRHVAYVGRSAACPWLRGQWHMLVLRRGGQRVPRQRQRRTEVRSRESEDLSAGASWGLVSTDAQTSINSSSSIHGLSSTAHSGCSRETAGLVWPAQQRMGGSS